MSAEPHLQRYETTSETSWPLAETRRERRQIEELHDEHQAAFELYLENYYNDSLPVSEIERDFNERYWAAFTQIDHFLEDLIEALEWDRTLTTALKGHDIPVQAHRWDLEEVEKWARRDFEFYYQPDQLIYVFTRPETPDTTNSEKGDETP